MSLVARTYMVMGVMVALILIVGIFAQVRTERLADTFADFRATATTNLLGGKMAQDISSMRLGTIRYRLTNSPSALEETTQHAGELKKLAPALIEQLQGYDVQSSTRRLPDLLEQYSNTISQIADFRRQQDELIAFVEQSGEAALQKLAENRQPAFSSNVTRINANISDIASNLMSARLYLNRFIVSENFDEFELSSAKIATAQKALTSLLTVVRDQDVLNPLQSVSGDLDQFLSAAIELSEAIPKRSALYARLDQIGSEALMLVNNAAASVVARQNTLGRVGADMAASSITIVKALMALGAIVGVLIAFFSGRVHSRMLKRVTVDMTQLAEGNFDLDLKAGNERHELRELMNAMAVLQDKSKKAKERDADLKEKERLESESLEKERLQDEAQKARRQAAEAESWQKDRVRMAALETFHADMEHVMDKAVSGNLSARMTEECDDANLSKLANLVNLHLAATETNVSDIVSGVCALAKGNLAVRIEGDRRGVFLAMQEDFNASVATLSKTMAKILEIGDSVTGTSGDLKNSSKDLAKRAEDNAATVEETSAAVEEITASIRQVVANAKAADQATQRVRHSADETREVSTETEACIKEMTNASAQINRVVKVIEDIAFQINLLALNAGVEAARAGEAGLGFSVVASEVRALALRSQEAVQEITQVIEQSNLSVEAGAQQVGLSRQALEGIITEVEVASGQISEIAAAVEEQAKGIEEVNTALRAIDVNAQKNAATLEVMMVSSEALSDEAGLLSSSLGEFEGVCAGPKPTNLASASVKQAHIKSSLAPLPKPRAKVSVASAGAAHQVDSLEDDGWDEF